MDMDIFDYTDDLEFLRDFYHLHGKTFDWAIIEEKTSSNPDNNKLKPGLIIEGSHAYVDLYERKLQSIRDGFGLAGYSRKPYRAKIESAGNDNKYAVLTSLEDPSMNIILPSSFVLDIHRQCWYGEWMDDGEHIMEI